MEYGDERAIEIVEEELLQLKESAIQATANSDASFYDDYLSEDAIGVTPGGVLTKGQIVAAIAQGSNFKSSKIDASQAKALSLDSGLVTYRATFDNPDGTTADVFVSTLYKRTSQGWKGVFYQQTPMPSRSPIKLRTTD
jgi:hypothetical protein